MFYFQCDYLSHLLRSVQREILAGGCFVCAGRGVSVHADTHTTSQEICTYANMKGIITLFALSLSLLSLEKTGNLGTFRIAFSKVIESMAWLIGPPSGAETKREGSCTCWAHTSHLWGASMYMIPWPHDLGSSLNLTPHLTGAESPIFLTCPTQSQ